MPSLCLISALSGAPYAFPLNVVNIQVPNLYCGEERPREREIDRQRKREREGKNRGRGERETEQRG